MTGWARIAAMSGALAASIAMLAVTVLYTSCQQLAARGQLGSPLGGS
jgi:hypothetical protein